MAKLTVNQNSIFKPVNAWKGRYRVLMGSAGSGKSVDIAQDYIVKLSDPRYTGANLLVVRKVYADNKDSTYAELIAAIYRIFGECAERFWKIRQSPLSIMNRITKNSIIFRGMKDATQREKVKSISVQHGKLTWIWCEEATDLTAQDIDILDTRLRGALPDPRLYYQMTFTFNPVSAAHWLKGRFFDVQRKNVLTHRSTYLNNRYCDPAFHQMLEEMKVHNPEYYQIYGLGEWGETGGLILTNYKIHTFDYGPERFDGMAFGTDFGFNHPHATLLLGWKDGEVYVCDELYIRQKDTNEIVKLTEKKFKKYKRFRMYCDSAEPDRIKTFHNEEWNATAAKKGAGSVHAQIDWLKARKIHIHEQCVNTAREIQQWKWQKDRKTDEYLDEPVELQDDAMAALRYGVEGWRRGPIFGFQ